MGPFPFQTDAEIFLAGFLATVLVACAVATWFSGRRWLSYALSGALGVAIAWAAAPSLAQSAGELVERVQKRTEGARPDAQAFFESVKGREGAFREQAQAVVDAGGSAAILKRGFAGLEDTDFRGGGALATIGEEPANPEGVVYVAVSFSMPPGDLRRLARDAQRAGAVVVIRGLVKGSFQQTLVRAKEVFDEESVGGVAIDPNVFRAFNIQTVPTFIAAKSPVQPCGAGIDCVPVAPDHDRVSGNITLGAALQALSDAQGVGAGAASAASQKLGD